MKLSNTLILVFGVVFASFAQKEINAKAIFEAIDKKQNTQYDGMTVVGDLDFTELSNRKVKNPGKQWQEIKTLVEVPVIFRNCTFKGDVIAYKNTQDDGKRRRVINLDLSEGSTTYSADFKENVVFENCVFENGSEFKYSKFARTANFAGCKFKESANFKYAQFNREALFADNIFEDYANFKYAEFSQAADFRLSRFRDFADFKYTEFKELSTFKQTRFHRHADFKYADFDNGVNFSETKFDASSDFKYSNGKNYRGR
jgi:uncharacterized protein YjbI with pentapeptide repeats